MHFLLCLLEQKSVLGLHLGAWAGDSSEMIGGAHEATERMEAAERSDADQYNRGDSLVLLHDHPQYV